MRGAGKSGSYVRRCATVSAQSLELARTRGLIDANPAKGAVRPRTSRSNNSESTLRLHYDGRTDIGKRKAIAAQEL